MVGETAEVERGETVLGGLPLALLHDVRLVQQLGRQVEEQGAQLGADYQSHSLGSRVRGRRADGGLSARPRPDVRHSLTENQLSGVQTKNNWKNQNLNQTKEKLKPNKNKFALTRKTG